MFGICFVNVLMFVDVYLNGCKYLDELSYKATISDMVIILSCYHDVSLLRRSFIVNIKRAKLYRSIGSMFSFLQFFQVLGVV